MDNIIIDRDYVHEVRKHAKPAPIIVHVKIAILQNSPNTSLDSTPTQLHFFEKTFRIERGVQQGNNLIIPIGRTVPPEEGIRLEHPTVSRNQGQIILLIEAGKKEPYFYYKDTSTFGSSLNSFRFRNDMKPLRNNDVLGIGLYPDHITPVYTLEFHYECP